MGPLSHVYVSLKVTKKKTPLLTFGSILPDISWGSLSQIGREKIHGSPREFHNFVLSKYPDMIDLGLGVRLHTATDRGADYYSDDVRVGFAYQEAPKIVKDVSDLLELETKGIPIPWKFGLKINSNSWLGRYNHANEKVALKLAHNFIEAGVELNLFENQKSLLKLYKKNLKNLDLQKITILLADYLNMDKDTVGYEVRNYYKTVNFTSTDIKALVEKTIKPILKVLIGRDLDSEKLILLAKKSKEITKGKYKDWLDNAVKHITVDFKDLVIE